MSEEILKALIQLFAIFSKQDYGTSRNERDFVVKFFHEEMDQDSIPEYLAMYDQLSGFGAEGSEKKRTSVSDSVKTLSLCRKINKTLTQRQKAVVLIKIMELITSDSIITPTELEILNTVAEVFNFSKQEYFGIENFVFYGLKENVRLDTQDILIISSEEDLPESNTKHLRLNIHGAIIFHKVTSVNMYFLRYFGEEELVLNGFVIKKSQVYLFSNGSTIKLPSGEAVYFSEIVATFNNSIKDSELSFIARDLEFTFAGGSMGLRNINLEENGGKLIGIMGSSGAGKTTLLNVLAGLERPSRGEIRINGIDAIVQKDKIQGIIGYVSQDDLLIEDLSVYQNLFYNAKLCFGNLDESKIHERVIQTLISLNLDHIKDLKVGNALNKKISGGQRKRLNIALELIREPAILFVDEPTSGLSSRDSENVIDLLKELSLKGKLIFVVIHQPSSEIYKMFDRMFILDVGGYPVYYGDPVEAVAYFKEIAHQVDKHKGLCKSCGNVNPEQIFNIIDAKVVDEYGRETQKRKIRPEQWHEQFISRIRLTKVNELTDLPQSLFKIPSKLKQVITYTGRDFFSKISNAQYLVLNFTEAPLLALILTWITKYYGEKSGQYIFRYNDNLPIFFLMSIVVALFLGLTVSAEEILRDKKILKRESFLNLSWNSYLVSKLILLFGLSAIQSLTFVLISIQVLEIHGMFFSLWLLLFSVSAFANVVGLMISAAFNSPVTVYILIPIILIPQMILSGLMFPYSKLNKSISSETNVPLIADLMTSRWAVEALFVDQYINNPYEAPFYKLNRTLSESDYKSAYLLDELKNRAQAIIDKYDKRNDTAEKEIRENLELLKTGLKEEQTILPFNEWNELNKSSSGSLTIGLMQKTLDYINNLIASYQQVYNTAMDKKAKLVRFLENKEQGKFNLNEYKNRYYNEQISNTVRNLNAEKRLVIKNKQIWRVFDPIYNSDYPSNNPVNFSTQFYAPVKPFLGFRLPTFSFNLIIIWIMTLFTYTALYFSWLPRLLASIAGLSTWIKNKLETIKK